MAAPEWIQTPQGDLIRSAGIDFFHVVGASLVIVLTSGQSRNYLYQSIAAAEAALATYNAIMSPSSVPGAPSNLAFDIGTGVFSWSEPATGAPTLDYLIQWGTTPGGPYPNSGSTSASTPTALAAQFDLNQGTNYYAVIQARNSSTLVSVNSNEVAFSVGIVNLIPTMTSDTTPSGVVASSSTSASPGADWEAFGSANGWTATGGPPQWLSYHFPVAYVVKRYSLAEYGGGVPKDWTFEGSNDGASWTTLDTQTNQAISGGATFDYDFTNHTAYLYYRINISATLNDLVNTGMRAFQMAG